MDDLICKFCNKQFDRKSSVVTHQPYCQSNPNRAKKKVSPRAGRNKGCTAWNKGLQGHPSCARPNQHGQKFGASLNGHDEKTKEKLSKLAKKRGLGGYVKGSGRGIKGWYNGIFCDSSWELAYVVYCLDHDIGIKRNKEKRTYIFNNEEKIYVPDFIINDNEVVEIKGVITEEWKAKNNYNPDVTVLYQEDMKEIFDYVTETYGNNFTKLYEEG